MAAKFKNFTFNASDVVSETRSLGAPKSLSGELSTDAKTAESTEALDHLFSDEAAARHYAEKLLQSARDDDLSPAIAPEESSVMPGLALERTEELYPAKTRTLHFEQRSHSIPIFGTNAVVEIEADTRRLVSFDAQLTNPPDVSSVASISPSEALERLADDCASPIRDRESIDAPQLCFFAENEGEDWHLTYHFKDVPGAPREVAETLEAGHTHGHGIGPSPRDQFLHFDYLVDAHSGDVVYYFSAQPFIDVPVVCEGNDEFGVRRQFFGRSKAAGFELIDPLRNIETYDHGFKDINAQKPGAAIGNEGADFASSNTAGVSAHYHAQLVFDFFNDVLKRNGIDGKGMRVISLVNCTYSGGDGTKAWRNAVWWKDRMWYGQTPRSGKSGFESFSRFLDVIAHELSHGVTATTSKLVYRDEPGALNESFSDIFGVMVANWYPGKPNPLSSWNWELGAGLGDGGLPLRDLSNPTRTGDPDHWSKRRYIGTPIDNGGVHVNSNIHNKAAYNLLTAAVSSGDPVLSPEEVALLYYLTLTRLSRRATFKDCLRVLRSVSATYFRGDPAAMAAARNAIDEAYARVGIE